MFDSPRSKRLSQNQINGQQGEHLVSARVLKMGLSFQGFNRLETGIDGMLELRDQGSEAMLGKWVGVQIKTTDKGSYSFETDEGFQYLLEPGDLAYWKTANLPVIIVLLRLSDQSMYWKAIDNGDIAEPRRLFFDKSKDVFDSAAADAVAALTIDKNALGSYVPPMVAGEDVHLNLIKLTLPDEIYVARSSFRSSREAQKAMFLHSGRAYFDWVLRDGSFWSFRDPSRGSLSEIVDVDTIEVVETEAVSLLDDAPDQAAFQDLLRRSVEAQLYDDVLFDKDSRSLYFRAAGPSQTRKYAYRSLQNDTSADVVMLIKKDGRDAIMRHHAFLPRYERIADDWYVSIQPTFVFTTDGFRPHPISSVMLAGKKKLERNGAIRGQFVMWRHLLMASGQPAQRDLLSDPQVDADDRAKIGFLPLDPIRMPVSVPESTWRSEDPEDADRVAGGLL